MLTTCRFFTLNVTMNLRYPPLKETYSSVTLSSLTRYNYGTLSLYSRVRLDRLLYLFYGDITVLQQLVAHLRAL